MRIPPHPITYSDARSTVYSVLADQPFTLVGLCALMQRRQARGIMILLSGIICHRNHITFPYGYWLRGGARKLPKVFKENTCILNFPTAFLCKFVSL